MAALRSMAVAKQSAAYGGSPRRVLDAALKRSTDWHLNWHPTIRDCLIPSRTARTATPQKRRQNGTQRTSGHLSRPRTQKGAIGGDVVAVLNHHQCNRPLGLARQTFGILCRYDAIEPPIHDEEGTGNILRHTLKRQCVGILARFILRLAMATHSKGFSCQFR